MGHIVSAPHEKAMRRCNIPVADLQHVTLLTKRRNEKTQQKLNENREQSFRRRLACPLLWSWGKHAKQTHFTIKCFKQEVIQ